MKIAICEDEMICTDILETHIRKWATDNGIWVEVFTYESAEQFLFYLNENAETDLLFLDIKLSGINGVELAKKLRGMKHTMQIVFTTDTEKYVYEGYNVAALNYLVKPVKYDKFCYIMNQAKEMIDNQKFYLCKTSDSIIKIPYEDIIVIEMDSHNAVITTKTGKYITRRTISEILNTLQDDVFLQCHKSRIVNIQHVFSISKKLLCLSNGLNIDVSSKYIKELNERFISYNKNRR